MLDTYIKAVVGIARFLLLLFMEFFGPVARIIFGIFGVGGILAFLFVLVGMRDHPRADLMMYSLLASGLIGMTLLMQYEILLARLYYDRLNADIEDDEEESVPMWRTALNWLVLLALLAAFCTAANWWFGHVPYHIKGVIFGAAAWMVLGMAMGVVRWSYRLTGGVPAAAVSAVRNVFGSMVIWAKKKASVRKAARLENNVVQFRKR
ncbi:MAG TPA: hypothetical protein VFW53_09110 [Gallionella sp.]|nr:hypothetical protein [Gallionella sp.]